MFLVNSRLGHFTAPSNSSSHKSRYHHQKDPFSRSYGARLPSSLTRFLSRALVYSTFPPVSVLVRLPVRLTRSFSWQHGINRSASPEGSTSHNLSEYCPGGFTCRDPLRAWTTTSNRWPVWPPASLLRSNAGQAVQEYSTCCPLPTPFGLGLGAD